MKTFASLTNEAKSPRLLISDRRERLHFFISGASSLALVEGDFIEKGLGMQVLFLAGMAGFEPADTRVKVWCLTAWRHPKTK